MLRRKRQTASPSGTDVSQERQHLLAEFQGDSKPRRRQPSGKQPHQHQAPAEETIEPPIQQQPQQTRAPRLDPADMHYLSTTLVPTGNPMDTDLNSLSATRTLQFTFYDKTEYNQEILLFSTPDPVLLCLELKRWNYAMFLQPDNRAEGVVRVEYLALDKMDLNRADSHAARAPVFSSRHKLRHKSQPNNGLPQGQKAHLLILPYAATARLPFSTTMPLNYTILAIILPHDDSVRWFYTPFLLKHLLAYLQRIKTTPTPNRRPEPLIVAQESFEPNTIPHVRLSTFVREMFCSAVEFPESSDWRYAMAVGDYCPPVKDEDEAVGRLLANEFLYFSKWADDEVGSLTMRVGEGEEVRLGDDRYMERLGEVERMVAGMVGLKCAEYMHIKRDFFKAFFEEVYRSDKPVLVDNAPAQPITGTAHRDSPTPASTPPPSAPTSTRPRRGLAQRPDRADTPMSDNTPSRNSARTGGRPDSRGGAQPGWKKRIRTEHAHQVWLEREFALKPVRAKMLVTAWRELGFLDEAYFVEWIRNGGVFEGVGGGRAGSEMDGYCGCG